MASIDELWLVDFGDPHPDEPAHRRPALVSGPSPRMGRGLPFVFVCPLTTTRRDLTSHVEVGPSESTGLHEVSYVQTEKLRSISRRRLVHRLGVLDPVAVAAVHDRLRVLLDL